MSPIGRAGTHAEVPAGQQHVARLHFVHPARPVRGEARAASCSSVGIRTAKFGMTRSVLMSSPNFQTRP